MKNRSNVLEIKYLFYNTNIDIFYNTFDNYYAEIFTLKLDV